MKPPQKRLPNRETRAGGAVLYLDTMYNRFYSRWLSQLYQNALTELTGTPHIPVMALDGELPEHLLPEYYVQVANPSTEALREELGEQYGEEPVHASPLPNVLNEQALKNPDICEVLRETYQRHGSVPLLGFTQMRFNAAQALDIPEDAVQHIGPDPEIAEKFDAKSLYTEALRDAGVLRHEISSFNNAEELLAAFTKYPAYISPDSTAGGIGAGFFHSRQELAAHLTRVPEQQRSAPFVASPLVEITSSPNVSALVAGPGDTRVISISEQLMDGAQYRGNIFPPQFSRDPEINAVLWEKIVHDTQRVGDVMAEKKYRGPVGLDFIIPEGDPVEGRSPVDLNPRRNGNHWATLAGAASRGVNLPEDEVRLAYGHRVKSLATQLTTAGHAWAQAAITSPQLHRPTQRGVESSTDLHTLFTPRQPRHVRAAHTLRVPADTIVRGSCGIRAFAAPYRNSGELRSRLTLPPGLTRDVSAPHDVSRSARTASTPDPINPHSHQHLAQILQGVEAQHRSRSRHR